ncbi:hypothetical protein [Streptomyces sp. Ncost-T10-10d]|uniref:hypothetical protein n=1 Tax=Streptomyces sp. Ncost-T10-10d TaxID=1839774 RepID=UPI00081E1DD1|nr:hypothetical protein [Streptomyces sp. Ncost-T10-10d]SCF57214.1 hypothetical protein GA0115254_103930 [Streptomyces sp. Ncost-T10-10d]
MTTPPYPREEATALYTRFEHLPYPARMRAIAEHTRSLDGTAYRAAHTALDAGNPDERRLALFLAVVRRDLDAVSRALGDPLLRPRALAAAIRLPVDEQTLAELALGDLRDVRHHTYRILRLSGRSALADRLLPQVHERHGDEDTARLLPACTPEAAEQWLPRLVRLPLGVLHALARTAPAALAAHLADRLPTKSAERSEPRGLRARSRYLVPRLCTRDPAAGMLLLDRAPHLVTGTTMAALLYDPAAVLASLRRTGAERLPLPAGLLPRRVLSALAACTQEDIVLLATVLRIESPMGQRPFGSYVAPQPLLALLPPERRRRAVESRSADGLTAWRGELGGVAALAPADRAEIATRWLNGRVGRRTYARSFVTALLPLPDGEPRLRELAAAHRPFERAAAWPALLDCAALHGDPQEYARVLTSCERAWHDQEEVRRAALAAAGAAPEALLDAAPYAVLRDAAMTTVQSRDSTRASLLAAEEWLRRTAVSAAGNGDLDRAVAVVGLLVQVLADPRGSGTVRPLPSGRDVAVHMWERGGPWAARSRVLFAALFVRHLPHIPDLDEEIGRVARDMSQGEQARQATELWLADPLTRERRCAELLAAVPSSVVAPVVWRTIARRRTDLLDTVMDWGLPPHWVPRMSRSVLGRWLPRQRAALDAHLSRIAADDEAPLLERTDAAALMGETDGLRTLAGTAPQPVAAAALTALGERAADSGGVPAHPRTLDFLLGHAGRGGVRGRAAMTGVRALLDTVPDDEAVARFSRVVLDVTGSVGSRKAAVRGLSALSSPMAFAAVLAGWDVPGQHRDVHATMVGALVTRMDAPGVAERFTAQLHHEAVRDRVMAARPDRPSAADALGRFLAQTVATGEKAAATAAARALLGMTGTAAVREVVAAAVSDSGRPSGVRGDAARLLCAWAGTREGRSALTGALDAVVGQVRSAGEGERRDALLVLDSLTREYGSRPVAALDAVTEALRAAGLGRTASGVALSAALASLTEADEGRDGATVERWDRWLVLAGERPGSLDAIRYEWRGPRPAVPIAAIGTVVAALRARGSAVAELAAVELVARAGGTTRWADPWPGELAALRGSEHPDVAEVALLADVRRSSPATAG